MTPFILRKLAKQKFGDDWHGALAKEIPCVVRTVKRWDKGEHPIGAVMELRVREVCK